MRTKRLHFAQAVAASVAVCTLLAGSGCVTGRNDPMQPQHLRKADIEQTKPSWWLGQPAVVTVAHDDFSSLWVACRRAATQHGYRVDQTDYRNGLMTTFPLISKQFFEFWRNDVTSTEGVVESSLATMRRTIQFEISRSADEFHCVPKVVVERLALTERRITTAAQYQDIFIRQREQGSRERDTGYDLPDSYWYAVGRDNELERDLARSIEKELHRRSFASAAKLRRQV